MKSDLLEIKERVRSYIHEKVHAEKDKVKDDSMIFTEGFIDSMGFMDLVVFLEQEFSMRTVDADLLEENFESINAISDFVLRKLEN
ncbi:MAG: acyl carrier protein [Bacteroidales bacterium]|jgi:acyl carrier protein|nr:acyl carrier protein [Bacteroidales bacterium]